MFNVLQENISLLTAIYWRILRSNYYKCVIKFYTSIFFDYQKYLTMLASDAEDSTRIRILQGLQCFNSCLCSCKVQDIFGRSLINLASSEMSGFTPARVKILRTMSSSRLQVMQYTWHLNQISFGWQKNRLHDDRLFLKQNIAPVCLQDIQYNWIKIDRLIDR